MTVVPPLVPHLGSRDNSSMGNMVSPPAASKNADQYGGSPQQQQQLKGQDGAFSSYVPLFSSNYMVNPPADFEAAEQRCSGAGHGQPAPTHPQRQLKG